MTEEIEQGKSSDKPMLGKGEYGDEYYYNLEVKDEDGISPKLKAVLDQVAKLEAEKRKLVEALMKKAPVPRGWKVTLKTVYEYGYIEVKVSKQVWIVKTDAPSKPTQPYPPKPDTPLEKLTRVIDPKVLFNSGILTKEEKRKLLGIDEICGNAPAANG